MALCAILFMLSCTPEKDSPTPSGTGNNPVDPPVIPGTDTVALFADKNWTTTKVYKDGIEQSGSWMIGTSYSINKSKSYFFNIPGFPAASGTWDFDASGKRKVNFTTQGPGFKWTILTLNKDILIVEQAEDNGTVMKFEFSN